MSIRIRAILERARASLFVLPMVAVFAAVLVAAASVWLDSRFDGVSDLPLVLSSTVDGARSILSTVAAATISFAGIAFSVSLLVIQGTSNQYSPRVVGTLFRDPFNKGVMSLVVGTFTYCVIVLRSVRGPLSDSGTAIIPNLSIAVAVVLGVSSILATVAFINHSAHSMDVSEILERTTDDAIEQIRRTWTLPSDTTHVDVAECPSSDPDHRVQFHSSGWVQQIDLDALSELVPPDGHIELHIRAGRYAVEGTMLCSVWGELTGTAEDPEQYDSRANEALALGPSRTMQQDETYGLRQLADVALKALSPGINDPTTAQDAIFHLAAVLSELLRRDPPPPPCDESGTSRVTEAERSSHSDLIQLAFGEVRRAAAEQPTVCIYLLEAMTLVREVLCADGLDDRAADLDDQARLVVAGCEASTCLPEDQAQVRRAHERRFGGVGADGGSDE